MIQALAGTSLIEYPGKISSVVFISGCNLLCPFCHNPELVLPSLLNTEYSLDPGQVITELGEREGFIEAVAITGGEPLLFGGLVDFITGIRSATNLHIKLDTNGTLPGVLASVAGLVDYVAMDLKSSPDRYRAATGEKASFSDIEGSIAIVKELPRYEFRTTMVPGYVTGDDVIELLQRIGPVRRYVLQRFRSLKTLAPELTGMVSYPREYLEETVERIESLGLAAEVSLRI